MPGPEQALGEKLRCIEGPRGDILDRDGKVLATSRLCYDVRLEIQANEDMPPQLATDLIAALELSAPCSPERQRRIYGYLRVPKDENARVDLWRDKTKKQRRGFQWMWERPIVRGLSDYATLKRLSQLANDQYLYERPRKDGAGMQSYRPGLFRLHFDEKWKRLQPLEESAGHIVGLPPRQEPLARSGAKPRSSRFAGGLEAAKLLDERSKIELPERFTARGEFRAKGVGFAPLASEIPKARLLTSIDSSVQEEAFLRLAQMGRKAGADTGFLCVADIESGDILALAGWPSYDPCRPQPSEGRRKIQFLAPTHQCFFVPGSLIKPLIVMEALEKGLVHPGSLIDCRGNLSQKEYKFVTPKGLVRIISDDHAGRLVPLERVLIESSNIGAVKVGMRGDRQFHIDFLRDFALRAQPRLGLPLLLQKDGQPRQGAAPSEQTLRTGPYYERDEGPSLSFGYALNIFPLSYLEAFVTAITGRRFHARLLTKAARPGQELQDLPEGGLGRRIFQKHHSAWLRQTLSKVVSDPGGTGRLICDKESSGWLGGKTGTSFLANNKKGTRRYWGSFVGFAPVARPRWVAFCVLEKSPARNFYGGKYAAPVVKDILLYMKRREERSRRLASVR